MLRLYGSWIRRRFAIVFMYDRSVKYSVNSLLACLEKRGLHRLLDVFLLEDSSGEEVVERVRWLEGLYDRVVVAFSLRTMSLPRAMEIVSRVRRACGERIVLLAGGPHASGDPLGTLELGFNIVFTGEGEKGFTELLEHLFWGEHELGRIPNIVFRENGRVRGTRKERVENLDESPPFPLEAGRFSPIEITRGCPFACGFCQVSCMFGCKPRHRSVENTLWWARKLLEKGIRDLRFIAPNSLGYGSPTGLEPSIESLEHLLSSLSTLASRLGGRVFYGSFPSEARPEFISEETLKMITRYTSTRRITVGAQSGSNRMLEMLHRGHTVEDVLNAVKLITRMGLRAEVDFIFGLPGETDEDAEETVSVMEKIIEMGGVIHAHYFMPLPGTPLGGCDPQPIHPRVLRFLHRMLGKGRVYGQWEKQEDISKMIVELRRRGVIRTGKCTIKEHREQ